MSDGDYCKQPVSPSPTASCYICLDGGSELLRNCACRGEAGWAHVACLAEFAVSQNAEAEINNVDPIEYWTNCNICKTPYMKNMGLAMAQACVKHYEHLEDTNYMLYDYMIFSSLFFMASASEEVGDYDGAMRMYTRLLEICKDKNKEGWDIRAQEAKILHGIGSVFAKQGRLHDAITAIENRNEIVVDMYGPNSREVQQNKRLLDLLNRKAGKGRGHTVEDTATALVLARKKFEKDRENGTNAREKVLCRYALISALERDEKTQEAMEQYEQMVSELTRVLGPDHPDTIFHKIQSEECRVNIQKEELCTSTASKTTSQKVNIWAVIDCEEKPAMDGQRVKVLRATVKGARKYICLHKDHKGVCSKFKTVQNQLIFEEGTKVVLHGLVSSKDLNGTTGIIHSFDKEKHRYAVEVGKKAAVLIKPINLDVVFA